MQRWEYQTACIEGKGLLGGKVNPAQVDEVLNQLGREGWELATAFDTNMSDGQTRYMVFTFKRPLA